MYKTERLDENKDDGTMPESLDNLRDAVVGRRIVSAVKVHREIPISEGSRYTKPVDGLKLTLDDGREVLMVERGDCCAYTAVDKFWLDPSSVDHTILGVGTTDGFTTWHIYADFGDIMELEVGWSCGNPFYYGYGFDIRVQEA